MKVSLRAMDHVSSSAYQRPAFARSEPVERTTSPRVAALLADPRSAPAFWAAAERDGTPLVEPDPLGDPKKRAVTFLWRDHLVDGWFARFVLLHANKFTDYDDPASCALDRVPGTDVWHATFRLPSDWRCGYRLGPLPAPPELAGRSRRDELMRYSEPDPLARNVMVGRQSGTVTSVAELDDAPEQRWVDADPDPGRCHELAVPGPHPVWLHRSARKAAGVLVLLDGHTWAAEHPIRPVLDAAEATAALPPLDVLLVGTSPAGRLADLGCNPALPDHLADVVLPSAAMRYGRDRTIVAGQSFGGLAAVHTGLSRPDVFGAVLAQSGSFWFRAGEWLRDLPGAEPVRVALQVGTQEWGMGPVTRDTRSALAERGHEVTLREYCAGHDKVSWRGGLVDGLTELAYVTPK
ncbi:enterochelin esterase domain-containing protein [Lentzea sp. NPDC058436]|uniref:enterochelin esterase domain-containing protein n=1 Tax=Lentzea sp. NPDC058436 TaxID=3346499 RepID=UPI00364F7F41